MNENYMPHGADCTSDFMDNLFARDGLDLQLKKRITAVNILPVGIRNAFVDFISMSRIGKDGFALYDLFGLYDKCLGSVSSVGPNKSVIALVGNASAEAEKLIAKNYVSGLYSLVACTHGFAIDCCGMSIEQLLTTRFVICEENKTRRFMQKLNTVGINTCLLGKTAADGSINIYSNGSLLQSTDMSALCADDGNRYALNIDDSFCALFKDVYIEASRYASVYSAGFGKYLMLPKGMTAEELFVSMLAVFAAQKTYAIKGVTVGFGDRISSVTVQPFIPCGAFVYIYSPTCSKTGYPDVRSCAIMNAALRDFKALGKSIAVIPVTGSVRGAVEKLGIQLEYTVDEDINAENGSLMVFLNRRDAYGKLVGTVGGTK